MRVIGIVLLAILLVSCGKQGQQPSSSSANTAQQTGSLSQAHPTVLAAATYTGTQACQLCHISQHQDWLHSDHHRAMMPMESDNVLGNFNDATLQHHGQTTVLTRQDDSYAVITDQQTSSPATLPLQYTFGIYPLQQYLAPQAGGRWQSLPFAWDSRPAGEGGQRWFHLYSNEPVAPGDALHWSSLSHNANHMCIECHVTNFSKGFDDATGSYHSKWQEIGVGCESCHGPGSRHVDWARSADKSRIPDKGWNRTFPSGDFSLWERQTTAPPHRLQPGNNSEVEQCAQCHSRRSRIGDSNSRTALLDAFLPSLLDESLYFADGQIQDEVYEYGSFLQSKMYQHGVTCSNCHNPHSGKPKIDGNGLCLQCHAATLDSPAHTMHPAGSPGSYCVNCHMPTRTYMQVDNRRDHSLRIPRPDLSVSLGTPNACTQCHADKSAEWSSNTIDAHQGNSNWKKPHYGTVIAAARNSDPASYHELLALVDNPAEPAIIRATAISLLPNYPTRDISSVLQRYAGDQNELIRLAVVRAAESLPTDNTGFLLPLLRDDVLAVRIESARVLAGARFSSNNADFQHSRDEYIRSQTIHADTAAANTNLATLAMKEQNFHQAEKLLQKALSLEPYYIPAAVNLADLYRATQRDSLGETPLRQSLAISPDNPELNLAMALWLVRNGHLEEAVKHLKSAFDNSKQPRFAYVYAMALNQQGATDQALAALDKAAAGNSYDRNIFILRVQIARDAGMKEKANQYLNEWKQRDYEDPGMQQF